MSKIKQFVLGTSKLLTRSGYIPISESAGGMVTIDGVLMKVSN